MHVSLTIFYVISALEVDSIIYNSGAMNKVPENSFWNVGKFTVTWPSISRNFRKYFIQDVRVDRGSEIHFGLWDVRHVRLHQNDVAPFGTCSATLF
jgi:hypothetical protein